MNIEFSYSFNIELYLHGQYIWNCVKIYLLNLMVLLTVSIKQNGIVHSIYKNIWSYWAWASKLNCKFNWQKYMDLLSMSIKMKFKIQLTKIKIYGPLDLGASYICKAYHIGSMRTAWSFFVFHSTSQVSQSVSEKPQYNDHQCNSVSIFLYCIR